MLRHSTETTFRRRMAGRTDAFASKHRIIYSFLISLLALIGYAYVFMFLYGVVMGTGYLIDAIPKAATAQDWEKIGAMISVVLLCAVTCLHIVRFRRSSFTGIPIEREQTPELFKLIESIRQHYGHRKIRQVILTDQFELDIRKTSVLGFPLGSAHTLVIGLPLLQSVAPKHFRCELARRMGQHSRREHHLSYRLSQARRLWNDYRDMLANQPRFGDQLLRWFFRFYAPLLDVLSLPAARREELNADSVSLGFINDHDVFETIEVMTVSRLFLKNYYWPMVKKMALVEGDTTLEPFTKFARLVCPTLQKIDGKKWLNDVANAKADPESPAPALKQRMQNIGHARVRDIPCIKATAAGLYLKEAQSFLIPSLDKHWQATTLPLWTEEYAQRRDNIDAIKALSELSRSGRLTFAEIWRYAHLAKTLKKTPCLHSALKLLRRNFSHSRSAIASDETTAPQRLNDVF